MRLRAIPLTIALILSTSLSALPFEQAQSDDAGQITVRGKIVCLDLHSSRINCDQASGERGRFALESSKGKLYRFLDADVLTAMFTDERIRRNELQITARRAAEGQLEIIKVWEIKGDRIYDVYYFCEVCNITSYSPGPCVCCQKEVELIETPVDK